MTENEQDDFVELLNSDLYLLPNYRCKYLLMRLNGLLAEGPVQTGNGRGSVSIEHVLPQTVDPSSEWARTWTPERQDEWRHKLANLVLPTGRLNSAASNYDFERKKHEYFANKNGTVSFALTTQVVHENEWTPEVVERRQERLVAVLSRQWEL